jgi:pyruvate/2-oxoglutarate dehydrogenase complex dihydrolipoamide dehydrogenase (E3) component
VLRTRTVSERGGFTKICKESDEILALPTFGFEASELMAVVQTAMIARFIGHFSKSVMILHHG